ncbi:uncharacterized protein LAESUDRAFT_810397 [Laetiporus sulphureus 93-53]|uniref:G-protein coupled receptors family 1 profile domain-containing protein n=1 Tax=Laetiporus sulphureus 93-53 TaxID=1314785 RepID=A0A165GBR8_9APHY|nr:uncharacterized protein LAESUDRAFT_810397 [Laetiporus sulphureus 93-53]KZT10124.1 hypothetical protein LAESUDRAFT_810397 [Laetiporus sulphureus 93-53]
MASFPLAESQIVSLFVQSVSYGVHVVTFMVCIWNMLEQRYRHAKPINSLMLSIVVILFVVGTADLAFNLYHNILAFTLYTGSGGATGEFEQISTWVQVIRSVLTCLSTLVTDAALIYRCWIVYERKPLAIAVPIIIWLGALASAVGELYFTGTLNEKTSVADARKVQPFLIAFTVLMNVENTLATGLLVYRIWRIHKQSSRFFSSTSSGGGARSRQLSSVIRIIVESALLYETIGLLTLVVDALGSNAIYAVSSLAIEIGGIQLDLILIRISRGIAAEHVQTSAEATRVQLQLMDESTYNHAGNFAIELSHMKISRKEGGGRVNSEITADMPEV